jgi:predicted nucleic acid-binding Zn ribbon protein
MPARGFRKEGRSEEAFALGDIIQALMQRKEFKVGAPMGQLRSDWQAVVGERLAEETTPAGLERGTLTVTATTAAWAAQVQFLADEVAQKANEVLGSQVVRRVRVTVRKPL